MANAFYAKGKEALLGSLNLSSANMKLVLVDSADYTINLSTDNALDDIAAGARVATSGNLANKTITDGVFDCDDVTFSSVTGDQFEYVILYEDSGVESTSRLVACWDTATGLAFTPSSGDITLTIDASGLFTL